MIRDRRKIKLQGLTTRMLLQIAITVLPSFTRRESSILYILTITRCRCSLMPKELPQGASRARYYGQSSLDLNTKNISIEIKQSAASGRSKSIKTNEDIKKALSMGLIDKIYGLCLPVVKISYVREYFKYKDWRLTLDRDIIYEKLGNSPYGVRSTIDPCFVLEIKTSIDQDKNILRNFFNFPRSKFSKYERAFEYLAS